MAVDKEELKEKIVEFATKKSKFKSKMYIKDLYKADPDAKPREVKNAANELVREGRLEFFSSGSTTMYGVPGFGKSEAQQFEGEE
ncbi:MAG: dissimilatory sulfite reductase D family protein [Dissulfuribacterales bacterium]